LHFAAKNHAPVTCSPLHVDFNEAQPDRRNLLDLPSGVGPLSLFRTTFRTTPATIYTIADTRAMLKVGQQRSNRKKRP